MLTNNFALTSRRVLLDDKVSPATLIVRKGLIVEVISRHLEKHELPIEDVGDSIVLPGLVDTHVHINEPGRTDWEGFMTATQSAAASCSVSTSTGSTRPYENCPVTPPKT